MNRCEGYTYKRNLADSRKYEEIEKEIQRMKRDTEETKRMALDITRQRLARHGLKAQLNDEFARKANGNSETGKGVVIKPYLPSVDVKEALK